MSGQLRGLCAAWCVTRWRCFYRHSVCGLVCLVILSSACGSPDAPTDDASTQLSVADAFQSVVDATDGYVRPDGSKLSVAGDLLPHADAQAESWDVLAIVSDSEKNYYAIQHQFARLGLRDADYRAEQSDWAFRDVMRATWAISNSTSGTFDHASVLQRVALQLAGADASSGRVWLDNQSLTLEHRDMPCGVDYQLQSARGIDLTLTQLRCPTSTSRGGLASSLSSVLAVSGTVLNGDERLPVEGRGWVRRGWGDLPLPGGAVVFDQLLLELEDLGNLELMRSKRRTGRGPTTLSMSWQPALTNDDAATDATGLPRRAIDPVLIDFQDDGAQTSASSGYTYPTHWQLSVDEPGIDVTLTPLIALQEIDDLFGTRWRGAVLVSGSHTGVGFVEFVPLAESRP